MDSNGTNRKERIHVLYSSESSCVRLLGQQFPLILNIRRMS